MTSDDFHLSEPQRELFRAMSSISESCYSAGWKAGLEYALWEAIETGDLRYGRGLIDHALLARCHALSVELGGWIIWVDDYSDPGLPAEEWGGRFVEMDRWLRMFSGDAVLRDEDPVEE